MKRYRIFSVCLPEDLIKWLDDRARREHRSRNQLIKAVLEDVRAGILVKAEKHGEAEAEKESEQPAKLPPYPRLRRAY